MPIYTKKGDKGTTGLADDSRISKAAARIEALGSLDEANSAIGLLVVALPNEHRTRDLLVRTQSMLFSCGARLAQPSQDWQPTITLPDAAFIRQYEQSIDDLTNQMPQLRRFILPGGTERAARAHAVRSIVRRAERRLVALQETDEFVEPLILQFLNRLSDWFFTLARYYNFEAGCPDTVWKSPPPPDPTHT